MAGLGLTKKNIYYYVHADFFPQTSVWSLLILWGLCAVMLQVPMKFIIMYILIAPSSWLLSLNRARDKAHIIVSIMSVSSPNPIFDHLLELSHRDDSNKWPNIGFDEELRQVEAIEDGFMYLTWSSTSKPVWYFKIAATRRQKQHSDSAMQTTMHPFFVAFPYACLEHAQFNQILINKVDNACALWTTFKLALFVLSFWHIDKEV